MHGAYAKQHLPPDAQGDQKLKGNDVCTRHCVAMMKQVTYVAGGVVMGIRGLGVVWYKCRPPTRRAGQQHAVVEYGLF